MLLAWPTSTQRLPARPSIGRRPTSPNWKRRRARWPSAAPARVALFGAGSARAADNHSAIIEFLVDDVDTEYDRIRQVATDFVNEPTTMPWGNRSLLLRDPDGKLVNLFTPATPDAKAKFGR